MEKVDFIMLENRIRSFASSLEGKVEWSFDDRFFGALCQFEKNNEDFIIKKLRENFQTEWKHENISNADELVLIISDSLGGLRPGQRLYVTDLDKTPLVYAALWPWGDGQTVSLRLIPSAQGYSPDEMRTLLKAFRNWMGI